MNIVKELEGVLQQPHFMGSNYPAGVNLAVNEILERINELGLEIVEKSSVENLGESKNLKDFPDVVNNFMEDLVDTDDYASSLKLVKDVDRKILQYAIICTMRAFREKAVMDLFQERIKGV